MAVLLKAGTNVNRQDNNLRAIIHLLAYRDDADGIEMLRPQKPLLDLPDSNAQTPLLMACENGNIAATRKLVEAGAKPLIPDEEVRRTGRAMGRAQAPRRLIPSAPVFGMQGRTSLHVCAVAGFHDCLEVVASQILQPDLSLADNRGETVRWRQLHFRIAPGCDAFTRHGQSARLCTTPASTATRSAWTPSYASAQRPTCRMTRV
jgi:hypothetical protein